MRRGACARALAAATLRGDPISVPKARGPRGRSGSAGELRFAAGTGEVHTPVTAWKRAASNTTFQLELMR